MASRLTVLGSCGAWPEPGRACSGFLLEPEGFRVVLDLGYGAAGRLFDHLGAADGGGVDAVVVTHRHPDHVVDLHALFRARCFGARGEVPVPVYAARGVREVLWRWRTGGRTSWTRPSPGTDSGPSGALTDLAAGVDLFVCKASDRYQQDGVPRATESGLHLDARGAARAAVAARARRLLLTHFWPGNDRERTRREAAAIFDGPVEVAAARPTSVAPPTRCGVPPAALIRGSAEPWTASGGAFRDRGQGWGVRTRDRRSR